MLKLDAFKRKIAKCVPIYLPIVTTEYFASLLNNFVFTGGKPRNLPADTVAPTH